MFFNYKGAVSLCLSGKKKKGIMVVFSDKKLAIVCFGFRGRREKFIELQERMFEPGNVGIFAKKESGRPGIQYWKNTVELGKMLDDFDPDIVHAYVDRTVLAAMSIKMKFPTVIDMHDCAEYRGQDDPFIESVYKSDSPKIFASPGLADYVEAHYGITDHHVIMNLPLKKWLNFKKKKKLPGNNIVYFGGMASLGLEYDYRYYEKLFKVFTENGIDVHIYPADPEIKGKLDWRGCVFHDTITGYENLYAELSQYQAGFVGYNDIDVDPKILTYPQACVPNKTFDYLMAGIPTVSYNLGYSEKFVRNWGVCVQNAGDLVDAYYQAKSKEIDYKKWQERFLLDGYYDELAGIYDNLLKKPNRRHIPAKISLCMIVRDEEKNLAKCLDSVKDFVDEIVIVDTGSRDSTIEIARRYGARIYNQPWKSDFSFHRNQALSYAVYPWVMVMDADEVLNLPEGFDILQTKININRISDEIKGLAVKITDVDSDGNTRVVQNMVRLFRKGCAHYEGIVHNQIIVSGTVANSNIEYIHTGYDDESVMKKYKRSEALLLKRIKDDRADYDAHYYLANLYFEMGSHLNKPEFFMVGIKEAKRCFSYLKPGYRRCSTVPYFSLHYSIALAYCRLIDEQNTINSKVNCIEQAIKSARIGLEIAPDDPDLNFAMTQIAAYMTVIFGRQYLDHAGDGPVGWRYLLTTGAKYREIVRGQVIIARMATGGEES